MKIMVMRLAVFLLRGVYSLFPFKQDGRVVILSRQGNKPSRDIKMIADELEARGIKFVTLTKVLKKSIIGAISYALHMLKQMYHISKAGILVVDGYCILVSILPKKEGQKVIQIWHALGAIKKFGWQSVGKEDGNNLITSEIMCLYRNYDYVVSPSRITSEFYSEAFNIDKSKIVPYVLPRVDYMLSDGDSVKSEIKASYSHIFENGKTNILYAPTFRKGYSVDVDYLTKFIDFSKYNLVIKKHWLDKGDFTVEGNDSVVIGDGFSSLNWMRVCDKVISDYSAIIFEAAIMDKEVYMYTPDIEQYQDRLGLNIDMSKESIGVYMFKDVEDLCKALKYEYDLDRVREFKSKYVEVESDNHTKDLVDFILSVR